MTRYQIESAISGVIFGIYDGDTEDEALDAMAQNAGYANYAECCETSPPEDGEIIVTEVPPGPQRPITGFYSQYPALVEHLLDNLRGPSLERIQNGSVEALAAWLNDMDENGYIEIPASMSATRSPLPVSFPEYAPKLEMDEND